MEQSHQALGATAEASKQKTDPVNWAAASLTHPDSDEEFCVQQLS